MTLLPNHLKLSELIDFFSKIDTPTQTHIQKSKIVFLNIVFTNIVYIFFLTE